MKRVTGIGGVFFKAQNPERLYAWYEKHPGLQGKPGEGVVFRSPADGGITVLSIFPSDTTYFQPGRSDFMINFRMEDLDSLLETLHAEGVEIDPKREDFEYGRFAWVVDHEGNRIELWQPLPEK